METKPSIVFNTFHLTELRPKVKGVSKWATAQARLMAGKTDLAGARSINDLAQLALNDATRTNRPTEAERLTARYIDNGGKLPESVSEDGINLKPGENWESALAETIVTLDLGIYPTLEENTEPKPTETKTPTASKPEFFLLKKQPAFFSFPTFSLSF